MQSRVDEQRGCVTVCPLTRLRIVHRTSYIVVIMMHVPVPPSPTGCPLKFIPSLANEARRTPRASQTIG
jgi:hypothetical protein